MYVSVIRIEMLQCSFLDQTVKQSYVLTTKMFTIQSQLLQNTLKRLLVNSHVCILVVHLAASSVYLSLRLQHPLSCQPVISDRHANPCQPQSTIFSCV